MPHVMLLIVWRYIRGPTRLTIVLDERRSARRFISVFHVTRFERVALSLQNLSVNCV